MCRYGSAAVFFVLLALASLQGRGPQVRVNAEESQDAEGNVDLPKVDEGLGAIPDALSTDAHVVQRESESISAKNLRSHAEKFQFQAEVSRLMDIIINSLYSSKDIFLRELISNASDALDKIRFLSLTDKTVLGEGDNAKLDIQIKVDKDKKILTIRDRGLGMTKDDLIKNLGTIAKSGTAAFLDKMQKGGDLNLIGQFGVGFYSVYLVADYVEVISKHNDDKQYIWESKADGAFAVIEDTENEPLGRGTEIRIHFKDDSIEFLEEDKLRELVKKYSEFINFPIYLWANKEVEVEVPTDEEVEEISDEEKEEKEEKTGEESSDEEDSESSEESSDEEDSESSEESSDEEDSESKPKTKTIKETKWIWELLNDMKAVWLRNPKDVTEDEYSKFFHSLAKDLSEEKPLAWNHFSAEGDVEFKALLFIPPKAPYDFYENYYTSKSNLKLYVRRVFISEEFNELLPKYLSFLKGIVDSDTLPLNVSREMLQQHSSLKTIKKKLIRKALDLIRRLAEEDPEESSDVITSNEDEEHKENNKKGQYTVFWNNFGKAIKLGIVEDASNRVRLAKLLRFYSSKSGDKLSSLDQYIARMKPKQKDIYFITGKDKEQLENSPFLENLTKKGYEVIYFTDPVDEYLTQYLTEYEGQKLLNVSKEGLKFGNKEAKLKWKVIEHKFEDLTKWWKDVLSSDKVEQVKVSTRLAHTPAVVVTSKYGWSANMERIMQAQTLSDPSKQNYMRSKRVLEINPKHPIIKELRDKVAANPEDDNIKLTAKLIYKTALLESGFQIDDSKDFASHVYSAIKSNLNISPDSAAEEEDDEVEEDSSVETDSSNEKVEPQEEEVAPNIEDVVNEVEMEEYIKKDEL